MRFRFFVYVITADIIKMYQQILVHPSQTRLQRILWRDDLSANIDTYELTTVTYDTASAPPGALSSMLIWLSQHAHQFTRDSAYVLRDFYVDDMFTGADTVDELTNSRWNHSVVKIRSIRVKQMGLELPWTIENRQSWPCASHYQR